MPRITITATIPAGQSLSNSIDLSAGVAQFIMIPPTWAPARLTFQLSHDGVTFYDGVDAATREIAMNVLAGTAVHVVEAFSSLAVGFMKLRSGSRDKPIIQETDQAIVISAVS
jgi:hypothetical protein